MFCILFYALIFSTSLVFANEDELEDVEVDAAYKHQVKGAIRRHPILVFPGLAGSQSHGYKPNRKDTEAKRRWVQAKNLFFPDRFIPKFRLLFNSRTNKTYEEPYTNIFPGKGYSWSVEYLGETAGVGVKYLYQFFNYFTNNPAWIRDQTLIAAPYDFRRAFNENRDFIPYVKKIVERLYRRTGNTKVVIVGHSMGACMLLNFLQKVPDNWKRKYIRRGVLVGAPLGGTVKMIKAMFSGEDFDIGLVRGRKFRSALNTFPSSYMFLPNKAGFGTQYFLQIGKKRYNADNLGEVFDLIDHPEGKKLYEMTKSLVNVTRPSAVAIDCLYNTGQETINYVHFHNYPISNPSMFYQDSKKYLADKPSITTDKNGDGTVNAGSLEICRKWGRNTKVIKYHKSDHLGLVTDKAVLRYIEKVATSTWP